MSWDEYIRYELEDYDFPPSTKFTRLSRSTEVNTEMLFRDADAEARHRIESTYPYAVRSEAEIRQLAEKSFAERMGDPEPLPKFRTRQEQFLFDIKLEKWQQEKGEIRRLFISAFIDGYQKALAKKDDASRPKVQPQPAAQPATSTKDTISIDGATFRVRKIERGADEVVYHLEINHPGVTNGVEVTQLAHHVSSGSASSYGYAASSSDAATGSSRPTYTYKLSPSPSQKQERTSSSSDTGSKFSVREGSQFYIKGKD